MLFIATQQRRRNDFFGDFPIRARARFFFCGKIGNVRTHVSGEHKNVSVIIINLATTSPLGHLTLEKAREGRRGGGDMRCPATPAGTAAMATAASAARTDPVQDIFGNAVHGELRGSEYE
jgi:hypothetical protein